MALVSLNEAKEYLRVDSPDEDGLINGLISSAGVLVKDVGRISNEQWTAVNAEPTDDDSDELITLRYTLQIAVLYTIGYLFEHRDEADHHALVISLRNLLFSIREGVL